VLNRVTEVLTQDTNNTLKRDVVFHFTGDLLDQVKRLLDGPTPRWIITTLGYDPALQGASANSPNDRLMTTIQERDICDGVLRKTTITYDSTFRGREKSLAKGGGDTTLCPQTLASELPTKLTYYADGLLKTSTDPNNDAVNPKLPTTFLYDAYGRPQSETRPDGGSTTYSYFNFGTPTTQYSQSQTTTVDSSHSSTSKRYFDGIGFVTRESKTGDTADVCVDRQKDAAGRLLKVSKPYLCSQSPTLWTTYTYDDTNHISRLKSVASPDGMTTNYSFGTISN